MTRANLLLDTWVEPGRAFLSIYAHMRRQCMEGVVEPLKKGTMKKGHEYELDWDALGCDVATVTDCESRDRF